MELSKPSMPVQQAAQATQTGATCGFFGLLLGAVVASVEGSSAPARSPVGATSARASTPDHPDNRQRRTGPHLTSATRTFGG